MTKDEKNRLITERMGYDGIELIGGKWCYHNKELDAERGGYWTSPIPDWSTDANFLPLWRWARGQGWWNKFALYGLNYPNTRAIPQEVIEQPIFFDLVAEWLVKEE